MRAAWPLARTSNRVYSVAGNLMASQRVSQRQGSVCWTGASAPLRPCVTQHGETGPTSKKGTLHEVRSRLGQAARTRNGLRPWRRLDLIQRCREGGKWPARVPEAHAWLGRCAWRMPRGRRSPLAQAGARRPPRPPPTTPVPSPVVGRVAKERHPGLERPRFSPCPASQRSTSFANRSAAASRLEESFAANCRCSHRHPR